VCPSEKWKSRKYNVYGLVGKIIILNIEGDVLNFKKGQWTCSLWWTFGAVEDETENVWRGCCGV